MKVCVVNPNYYRSSGVTVAIRRIHQGVTRLDVDQYFVDCGYGNEVEDTSWVPGDRLLHFGLMTPNPLRLATQIGVFVRWLKRNDIKVVHVHHRRLAALLNCLQPLGGYTLIYTGQLTYPFALWFWLASPRTVTAISPSVAQNLRSTTRCRQPKLISNPSEFPADCPTIPVEEVKDTAVCIARLEPVKGHEYLIRAWKMLADRGMNRKLMLVGEGSLKHSLQSLVSELGLTKQIEFRGFQSDVMQEVRRSLFGVLVSQVEGQGIVTIETASCGRPSLLTDVDGSRDCIPPECGLPNGIEYGNPAALADALEAWFNNPYQVVEDGKKFYEFLKASSSMETVAGQYTRLYGSVA